MSDLDYGCEEEAAVLRVLRGKWLSMGPEVEAFEREFAALITAEYAVAVANGTAALHLAYLALGIGSGDEVIQPAINFVAAANLTVALGAVPVFADITGPHNPLIDPGEIERRITPRTKAVVVMHYGGYPCRMAEICALSARHGIALIEDACHAVGARYLDGEARYPHGKFAGTLADVSCFSFFSNKNLAIGEGGMVATGQASLAERIKLLRSHGMTTLTWDRHRGHASSYDVVQNGYNYRLDELRAALGRCQLQKLAANNARRRKLVAVYRAQLAGLADWIVPFNDFGGESAAHLMVVLAPTPRTRASVASALRAAGIQTSLHYPVVADFKAFCRYADNELPQSRLFAARALSLPLFPALSEAEVEEICTELIKAVGAEGGSGQ